MFQKIHILTLVMIGKGRNELNILQGAELPKVLIIMYKQTFCPR